MTCYDGPEQPDLESLTVAVFGLGKMGLPLAAVLADQGASVVGVDIDEDVVAAVRDGESPIENEPGVPELVSTHGGDQLRATADGEAAAAEADVSVVLVPTLLDGTNEPDLSAVLAAGEAISGGIEAGDLVILESTVPPGTTAAEFSEALTPDDRDLEPGADFGVAHCPERTYAGRVLEDLTESYPKIVGGVDEASTRAAAAIYRQFNEPGVRTLDSATAAEAVKVFEGIYRDVNIALANELALACEEWGIDASEIFEAANGQPFCDIHEPGVGVGGHCIPVYPHFATDRAADTELIETARRRNDTMPDHAVGLLEDEFREQGRSLSDARVLVLGVTYRPGVAETRYAPSRRLVEQLEQRGATVLAHDPLLTGDAIDEVGARSVPDPTTVPDLDGVVLATGHDEYRELDLDALAAGMRTPILVDGRNAWPDPPEGAHYRCIGDGTAPGSGESPASPSTVATSPVPRSDGGPEV